MFQVSVHPRDMEHIYDFYCRFSRWLFSRWIVHPRNYCFITFSMYQFPSQIYRRISEGYHIFFSLSNSLQSSSCFYEICISYNNSYPNVLLFLHFSFAVFFFLLLVETVIFQSTCTHWHSGHTSRKSCSESRIYHKIPFIYTKYSYTNIVVYAVVYMYSDP